MGVPTNNSKCVQGAINKDQSFIVIGGTTSTQNYNGLQHYSFSSKKWTSDQPVTGVATNRVGHGAAYLQQSSSILMYAGSQDSNYSPSSQTFLIQTSSPYNVQAFESNATPVTNPLMMPWNASHALMLGGSSSNSALFTFGPLYGWQQYDVSLPSPLKDINKMQATVQTGSDGSKVLELFDLSTAPNGVEAILLQNATSASSSKRAYVPPQHHPSKKRKRDGTLANRPAYNNTLAPQNTRTGFSLAQDSRIGLIVVSGGSDQSPLAIFNQTGNQWVDPNAFFGTEPSLSPSSSAPSHTSSAASATSVANVATDHAVRNQSLTILGGVLGGVFGVAVLLVLILLLIRYLRRRRTQKRARQESSYALDDKAEMDFRDVGADYMKEAGYSPAPSNHMRNKSDKSDASGNAKVPDRGGATSSQSKRALLHSKGDSAGSGKSLWSRNTKSPDHRSPPPISAPMIMHPAPVRAVGSPDPRTDPRGDTGWSKYFTDNLSRDFSSGGQRYEQDVRPTAYLSNGQSQSDYTESRVPSSQPHSSAEIEPLSFRASQTPYPPNARVMSPTGFPRPSLGLALTHGKSPPRDDPPTPTTLVSEIDEEDERNHYSQSSGQDSWTPVQTGDERTSNYTDPRASHVSSSYDAKYPHPGERVRIPNFPAVPPSRPTSMNSTQANIPISPVSNARGLPSDRPWQPNNSDRGLRNIASRDFIRTPSGRTKEVPGRGTGRLPDYDTSQVRTFPRKQEELGERGRGGSQTEDMSWLNLGTSADQNNDHFRY